MRTKWHEIILLYILSDNLSTSIESKSTTEWLPQNLNYELDTSNSSKTQNSFDYDFDNIPLNRENQNTLNNVEEVLEVGVEGLRPKRKKSTYVK